jgi:putative endonuclease
MPPATHGGKFPSASGTLRIAPCLSVDEYPENACPIFGVHLNIGLTNNLQQRLATHNQGRSLYTSGYAPWRIVTAIRFDDDQRASAFEQYLKTGSGRAFANKHLW